MPVAAQIQRPSEARLAINHVEDAQHSHSLF